MNASMAQNIMKSRGRSASLHDEQTATDTIVATFSVETNGAKARRPRTGRLKGLLSGWLTGEFLGKGTVGGKSKIDCFVQTSTPPQQKKKMIDLEFWSTVVSENIYISGSSFVEPGG